MRSRAGTRLLTQTRDGMSAQTRPGTQAQSLVAAAQTPMPGAVALPVAQTPAEVAPPQVEAMVAWLSGAPIFVPGASAERLALRAEAERAGAAPLIAAIDGGHVGTLAPEGGGGMSHASAAPTPQQHQRQQHQHQQQQQVSLASEAPPLPPAAATGRSVADASPVSLIALGGLARANSPLASCECFDVRGGAWSALAPLPFARGYHAGAANPEGTLAWALGGSDGKATLPDAHELNLQAGTWRQLAPMPTPRIWLGACWAADRLIAVGGYNGQKYLSATELFDPSARTSGGAGRWTKGRDMPWGGRAQLGVAAMDGVVYAVGGFSAPNYLNVCEAYDPRSDQWWGLAPMSVRRAMSSWQNESDWSARCVRSAAASQHHS